MVLRHDIQRLADAGLVTGPVTSWPLSWGAIASDLAAADSTALAPDLRQSLARVRQRASAASEIRTWRFRARASAAASPSRLRSFQDTPRDEAEVMGGLSWTGDRLSFDLRATAIADPLDGEELRLDGSHLGVALGNFGFSANTLDRWWGPGWDSSLILGSNARPMSWLGPWDLAVHFGRFESDRHIPDARFFGLRFNFRPLPSLEIGLSRAAQWCGEGRPCGFDTFVDLLLGNDNRGGDGIDR